MKITKQKIQSLFWGLVLFLHVIQILIQGAYFISLQSSGVPEILFMIGSLLLLSVALEAYQITILWSWPTINDLCKTPFYFASCVCQIFVSDAIYLTLNDKISIMDQASILNSIIRSRLHVALRIVCYASSVQQTMKLISVVGIKMLSMYQATIQENVNQQQFDYGKLIKED